MRLFIAVPCPGELQNRMAEFIGGIPALGKISLVKPENIHLTLKFLGDVTEKKIPEIREELRFLSDEDGFQVSIRGMGAFPNMSYIRVIWFGTEKGSREILKIHQEIDSRLKRLGFPRDKKFHPHFTIARVKFLKKKDELKNLLLENRDIPVGEFEADRIELMQSKLSPKGTEYVPLHKFKLK
jgi:2'-5' RNA ligase